MMHAIRGIASVITFLVIAAAAHRPATCQERAEPPTNVQVYMRLARQLGDSLSRALGIHGGRTITLAVQSGEAVWYLEHPLIEAFSAAGARVMAADSTHPLLTVGVTRAQVRYASVRRDGFLGPRIVDRTVELVLNTRLSDRTGQLPTRASEVAAAFSDTVDLDAVRSLEDPGLTVTRGIVPREGFFSSVLEPVITVSAVAVAIYLLFTVRK